MTQAHRIQLALANHRRPPRTNGGRVHDALAHVRHSKKRQSPRAAGFINADYQTPQPGAGHG